MTTAPVVLVVDANPSVRSSPKPFRDQDLLDAIRIVKAYTRRAREQKAVSMFVSGSDALLNASRFVGVVAQALAQGAHEEGNNAET